jgi:hypothetical protein
MSSIFTAAWMFARTFATNTKRTQATTFIMVFVCNDGCCGVLPSKIRIGGGQGIPLGKPH